jgi:hypothetical protein
MDLRQASGIDAIPHECLKQLPTRPLAHLTNLFYDCIRLSHFPKSLMDANMTALPKPIQA